MCLSPRLLSCCSAAFSKARGSIARLFRPGEALAQRQKRASADLARGRVPILQRTKRAKPPRRASAERPVDAVAQAVVAADEGKKPRIAAIEGAGREVAPVEGVDAVRTAEDLPPRLRAEIAHRGDPAAVAAEGIVHAVLAAHVGEVVEGEGHVPGPGVSEPDASELREAIRHVAVEHGSAHLRRHLGEAGAAAEEKAPAV